MGRHSTGAITTGEVTRIELTYLLKMRFVKMGHHVYGTLNWTNGGSIQFESKLNKGDCFIRLVYNNTNSYSGEVTNHDYKINLTTIPSNLGKGEVIYFVCPVSGTRCRVLYKCYGSLIWKSRKAYRHRIYYHSQACSKYDYHNTRYWDLTRELDTLYKKSKKNYYKGNYTRLMVRVKKLEGKQQYHDRKRWLIVPQSIQKMVNSFGLPSAKDLF